MIRRNLLVIFLAIASTLTAPAEELAALIENLGDDRFMERQKASIALVEAAGTRFEEVVRALYAEEVQSDPEKRQLVTGVMRQIYKRQVLGVGAPTCGWRLERLISDDDTGRLQFMPIIGEVDPGSPVAKAGLAEGDEILSLGGKAMPPTGAVALLYRTVASAKPGAKLVLRVRRWNAEFPGDKRFVKGKPGEEREVTLELGPPAKEAEPEPFSAESFASWVALEVAAAQRTVRPASQ